MSDTPEQQLLNAIEIVRKGGVIAYPTEAVYGLGCDPFNKAAVEKILQLKQRSADKGLIVVASDWQQVKDWLLPLTEEQEATVAKTWAGPTTWVLPANDKAPALCKANDNTIAIRVSAFPIILRLCQVLGPIVSTSVNLAGEPAAKKVQEIDSGFLADIDYVMNASVGDERLPSTIFDAVTGDRVR
jgi:L-threonylcarbamoyladenylate synthase